VYRPQGVVFLGVENHFTSGTTVNNVVNYCLNFDWDFPVGLDTVGGSTIFAAYGTDRHNYMVIGKDGRIAHRAVTNRYNGAAWSTFKQGLINAINAALAVPVEPTSWGRIKSLLDQG
jgi:hypothetical protein